MGPDRHSAEALPTGPAPGTPGETLKRTREALNYGLDDMARRLHLSPAVIDALEEDRYDQLPEAPYVRGYLRSYARFLGLDPAALLASYEAISGPQESSALGVQRRPGQGLHRATIVWGSLAVVAVLVVLLWSWWTAHRPQQLSVEAADMAASTALHEGAGMLEEMPHERAGGVPAPEPQGQGVALETEQTPAPPQDVVPPQVEAQTAAQETATPQTVEGAVPGGQAPQGEAVAPLASVAQQTQAPALEVRPAGGKDRLRLAFSTRSWTEVYDADKRRLLFDLVKPGAVKTLEGRAPFRVILGDASGVRVSIDGVPFDHSAFRGRGKTARFQVARPGAD